MVCEAEVSAMLVCVEFWGGGTNKIHPKPAVIGKTAPGIGGGRRDRDLLSWSDPGPAAQRRRPLISHVSLAGDTRVAPHGHLSLRLDRTIPPQISISWRWPPTYNRLRTAFHWRRRHDEFPATPPRRAGFGNDLVWFALGCSWPNAHVGT